MLKDLVARHGFKWAEIAAEMQFRTAEQIRGRYTISLTPDRVNGSWTREEHRILLDSHQALGKSFENHCSQVHCDHINSSISQATSGWTSASSSLAA